MLSYALKLSGRYDGMVIATIPDVPEAMAIGRDHEEACEQALGALEAALETYEAEGRPLPEPRAAGGLRVGTERFSLPACAEECEATLLVPAT
jgi:predicted RNase H-like HicB family nuclease